MTTKTKKYFFLSVVIPIMFFAMAGKACAASRYWVGNGGFWEDVSHWSSASGGAGGASVPGINDDVIFDVNSFTLDAQAVVLDGSNRYAASLDTSSVSHTPTFQFTSNFSTITSYGNTYISNISFEALNDNKSAWIICIAGSLYFDPQVTGDSGINLDVGSGAESVSLLNPLNYNGNLTIQGGFNTSNFDIDVLSLTIQSGATAVSFGSSSINAGMLLDWSGTGAVDASVSHIDTGRILGAGNNPLGSVTLDLNLPGLGTITPSMVFSDLAISGNSHALLLQGDETINVTGTFSVTGGTSEIPTSIIGKGINVEPGQGNSIIEAETVSLQNVEFTNITAGGSAVPFSGTDLQDGGNNVNIDFGYRYWVGDGGNWNDTSHWSDESGGAGGASVPTADNAVFFDANPFALEDQTVYFPSDGISFSAAWNMDGLAHAISMNSIGEADPWTISIPSGTVGAKNTTLINSQATGGATFNAYVTNDNVDGGGNTGWIFQDPSLTPRYWVGDGGNWNDTAHWSTSSGGSGGASVPTANNDVIIDANSFTASGQQMLFSLATSETDRMILNFDGANGDTSWEEEAQGLEPDSVTDMCALDTDDPYSGTSSLKIAADPSGSGQGVDYTVQDVGADFTYTSYFKFHDVDDYIDPLYMRDSQGMAGIGMEMYNDGSDVYLSIGGVDSEGNPLGVAYDEISTLSPDTWHKLELNIQGRDVSVKIDEQNVVSWEAAIDNPLLGLDTLELWNDNETTGNDMWIDSTTWFEPATSTVFKSLDMTEIGYPITMDSTNSTDYWGLNMASGTVGLKDTTLKNSHATGGATFNAFVADGNVDGGGNTGWNFGEPITYAVTFDSNGGSPTPDPISNIIPGSTITLPDEPTREGYLFSGWNTQADGKGTSFNDGVEINGDLTVYAQWSESVPSNDISPERPVPKLLDIKDVTRDSVTLKVEITTYPDRQLDFVVKIRNENNKDTDEKSFMETTDNDGKADLKVDDLDSSTGYEFSVKYAESGSDVFSEYSNSKKAETEDYIEGDECRPAKLKAKAISSSQIDLSWESDCGVEEGFLIERKTKIDSFSMVAETKKSGQSYHESGLLSGTAYTYRVRSYKGDRFSDYSNEGTATTFDKTPDIPSVSTETSSEDQNKTQEEAVIPTESQPQKDSSGEESEAPEEKNDSLAEKKDPVEKKNQGPDQKLSVVEVVRSNIQESMLIRNIDVPALKKTAALEEGAGIITGTAMTATAVFAPLLPTAASPATLPVLPYVFPRFLQWFGFLGRSKRRKNEMGCVFDAETRMPIAGAEISIFNEDGKKLDSVTSDSLGRYSFLAKKGKYFLRIAKRGYDLINNRRGDEFYGDLYSGGMIEIGENEVVRTNISMKALNIDWRDIAVRKIAASRSTRAIIIKDAALVIFYAGFFATLAMSFFSPTIINGGVTVFYVLIGALKLLLRTKSFGVIRNKVRQPVPFSMISLYDMRDPNRRIAFAASDILGRYFFNIEDGSYMMKVQGQELNGHVFSDIFQVHAHKGFIKEDVMVG